MDYDEEQLMELEALEAIFVEDYKLVNDSVPRCVGLELGPSPGGSSQEENQVVVNVEFTLGETYPEQAPEIKIEPLKGLTDKQCAILLDKAKEEAENNVGMPMIFTISEVLKEWLAENNRDHTDESMHAQMMMKIEAEERAKQAEIDAERRKRANDDDDNSDSDDDKPRKIDGTPVNPENFSAWLEKFRKEEIERKQMELEAIQRTQSNKSQAPDAHLTGREYFELQKSVPANESQPVDEWDTEDVNEELFLEEDEEDLDDLDDLSDDDDEDDDDDDDDEEEEE